MMRAMASSSFSSRDPIASRSRVVRSDAVFKPAKAALTPETIATSPFYAARDNAALVVSVVPGGFPWQIRSCRLRRRVES